MSCDTICIFKKLTYSCSKRNSITKFLKSFENTNLIIVYLPKKKKVSRILETASLFIFYILIIYNNCLF